MTDTKSERLGLRGRLAHFESALKLLGGANATGAIASVVAFHGFAQNAGIEGAVKLVAILFLSGIFTFAIAYMGWFLAVLDVDHAMHEEGEPTWPEYLFWKPAKSPEEYLTAAKIAFGMSLFLGLASFGLFLFGLGRVLLMAVHFASV